MALKQALTGSGIPALPSNEFAGRGSTGLVATGTNQATALPIGSHTNVFSSVPSGTGCCLGTITALNVYSTLSAGDELCIINQDVNALLVYPPAGGSETINALSANAPYSLAAGKMCFFKKATPTQWYTNLGA